MAVLINQQGLAENVPAAQAQAKLGEGYGLPLNDPEGNPVVAPDLDSYNSLLQSGHTLPSSDQLQNLLKHAQYQTPGQTAAAFVEGAGEGASFGLSTGLERAMGVPAEDIEARRQSHPVANALGQATGLGLSTMLPAVGEAEAAQESVSLAQEALQDGHISPEEYGLYVSAARTALNPISAASLVGAGGQSAADAVGGGIAGSAAKAATEMMMLEGGDEVSRAFSQDPGQTLQTSITHMGLAGLMGMVGGVGTAATGRLFAKALEGVKDTELGEMLDAVKDKVWNGGGLGGEETANAPAELQAALAGNENARRTLSDLLVSSSSAGAEARESVTNFRNGLVDQMVDTLGVPREQAEMGNLSRHELGKGLQDSLAQEFAEKAAPVTEELNAAKAKVDNVALSQTQKNALMARLEELRASEGYGASPSGTPFKEIQRAINEVPGLNTVGDLGTYQQRIWENTNDPSLWRLGGQMRDTFRGFEEDAIVDALQSTGQSPEALMRLQTARQGYAKLRATMGALDDELRPGRYAGPESFTQALTDNVTPEDFLKRMSVKDNANFTGMLSSEFPKTADLARRAQIQQLVSDAVGKARQGEWINSRYLTDQVEKWSPELKNFVLSPEQANRFNGLTSTLSKIPVPAKAPIGQTLERVIKYMPKGSAGIMGFVTGHPMLGALAEAMNEYGIKEAPDRLRLGFLKFLGSDASGPANAPAFRSLLKYVGSFYKGETMLNKAADAVATGAKFTVPNAEMDEKSLERMEDHLHQLNKAPGSEDAADNFRYMPDTGGEAGMAIGRVAQILDSLKPNTAPLSPFGQPRTPSQTEEARYQRAAELLNQPLLAFQRIQDGTLTMHDVQLLHSAYPQLVQHMSEKLVSSLSEAKSKGELIPHETLVAASRFLNQPLSASMLPQNLLSGQNALQGTPAQQAQSQAPTKPARKMTSGGSQSLYSSEMTPTQAVAAKRAGVKVS